MDGQPEVVGKRIDDRHANAMQTARNLVRAVIELTAGMQHGHDDLGCGATFLGVDVGGNAAAVIRDGDRFVGVDGDDDTVAMASQRLVDGVIHNLENHVVEARAVIGVTDVHAGSLADRVETL